MSTYPAAEELDSIEMRLGTVISEMDEIRIRLKYAAGEASNTAYRDAVKAGLSVDDACTAAAKVDADTPTLSDAEASSLFAFCLNVLRADVPLLTENVEEMLEHVRTLKATADGRAFQEASVDA
jgi:hypothetical protein